MFDLAHKFSVLRRVSNIRPITKDRHSSSITVECALVCIAVDAASQPAYNGESGAGKRERQIVRDFLTVFSGRSRPDNGYRSIILLGHGTPGS